MGKDLVSLIYFLFSFPEKGELKHVSRDRIRTAVLHQPFYTSQAVAKERILLFRLAFRAFLSGGFPALEHP